MRMKWSVIATLAIALAPVQSYTQTSTSKYRSLNEQVLFRRTIPDHAAVRSPSPPASPKSPKPSSNHREHSQVLTQDLPPIGSLSIGSSQANEQVHSPPRASSTGHESDSSTDGGRAMPRARVRARVTGPATIRYRADHHEPRRATLAPGQKQRYTVRGHDISAIDVNIIDGNPPGKAEFTVRGRHRAHTFVNAKHEGSGSITSLAPHRQEPLAVTPGESREVMNRKAGILPERQKLKSDLYGPGSIGGMAQNPPEVPPTNQPPAE